MRLVRADVDEDGMVVRYLPERDHLVFSEPIILAALAAPPCYDDEEEQFLIGCTASYGTTRTQEETREDTLDLSSSLHVGFNVADRVFTQSEIEAKATITASVGTGVGSARSVTATTTFFNNDLDDKLLVRVAAFEEFTYEIIKTPEGEDGGARVGETLSVRVPRTDAGRVAVYDVDVMWPALRETQRQALLDVFPHSPGDPSSYPYLGPVYDGLPEDPYPLDDYLDDLGLPATGCDASTPAEDCDLLIGPPVMVSGSGAESVIARGDEESSWSSFGVASEVSLEITGGSVMVGASLGVARNATVGIAQGTEVAYGMYAGDVEFEKAANYSMKVLAFNYPFDCRPSSDPEVTEEVCDGFQVVTAATQVDGE